MLYLILFVSLSFASVHLAIVPFLVASCVQYPSTAGSLQHSSGAFSGIGIFPSARFSKLTHYAVRFGCFATLTLSPIYATTSTTFE